MSRMRWKVGGRDLGHDRDEAPQKFPVAEGDSSGAIHFDGILVELSHLYDCSSPVPFAWILANLVLDAHMISNLQLRQRAGTNSQAFSDFKVTVTEGFFSLLECVLPGGMRAVLAGQDWYR